MSKFFLIGFIISGFTVMAYAIGKLRKEVTSELENIHSRIDTAVSNTIKTLELKVDKARTEADGFYNEADKFFDEVKKGE